MVRKKISEMTDEEIVRWAREKDEKDRNYARRATAEYSIIKKKAENAKIHATEAEQDAYCVKHYGLLCRDLHPNENEEETLKKARQLARTSSAIK